MTHVAHWRLVLLQGTETFIRTQVDALDPVDSGVMIGFKRIDSALSRTSDRVAYAGRIEAALALRMFRMTRRSRRLSKLIESTGASVVHAHFADDAALITPTLRRMGIPLVVSVYGFDVSRRQPDTLLGRRESRRKADAFSYASRVVANSAYMARCAVGAGAKPEKVEVVHLGLFPTAMVPRVNPGDGVTFVGRVVEKKGLEDLIVAMSLLPAELGQVPLTVVGDGPLRRDLEERAKALGVRANFVGSKPPEEVAQILRASRLVCVPSKTAADGDSEGLPTIILDAAMENVPVVASAHSGIPEAVRDGATGLLVPEGDRDALASALARLLADPDEAMRFGSAARSFIQDEFDIARWSRSMSTIYAQSTYRSASREVPEGQQ